MDRYEEALAKARVEYEKARKQGYTWLMDLLEGMFPEVKESEDERIRKWLIEEIKATHDYDSPTSKKCVDDALSYLEKQKEQKGANGNEKEIPNGQKPAVWSEEDEVYLQDALWCVKQAEKVARGENAMGACWSAERWLKSLKNRGNFPKSNTNSPSWKPSEGQMRMLLAVINDPNNAGAESCHLMLQSLFADLQKLL